MNGKVNLILQPSRLLAAFMARYCTWLPDDVFLRCRYRLLMHKKLHLDKPKTFTEKIQWLKLHDRKPVYTKMADKYEVKDYVAQCIGGQYVIPTLGVWDKFDDIDFSQLPDRFVLKSTNGGGGTGVVICKDKGKLDKKAAKRQLTKSMNVSADIRQGEWVYKGIKPRIIAEKFIAPVKNIAPADLPDYKFFCFNGEPQYCQVIRDRSSKETIDFYNMDWEHQEFVGLNPNVSNGTEPVERPRNFDGLKDICRKLAKDIPFVRVDLYVVDDEAYFGELTFYPNSGFGIFTPKEWNDKLGKLLTLPDEIVVGGGIFLILHGQIKEIENEYDELKDYKFFCFNGKVRFFKVDFNRFVEHHANYYDAAGNFMPFGEAVYPPAPNAEIELPCNLSEMIALAEMLSEGHIFLRVDLYNVNGAIYFGETTFYPNSGFSEFVPKDWDLKIGKMLELPTGK